MHENLFLETIRITDNQVQNYEGHHRRILQTARANGLIPPSLSKELLEHNNPYRQGIVKCRIVYGENLLKIDYSPYEFRRLSSLKIIEDDSVEYAEKSANREALNRLTAHCVPEQDILIVKNGFLTDTSYSNIVLRRGSDFYTPSTYLLNGTKRQLLLAQGRIQENVLRIDDLKRYDAIRLINAMINLEDNIEISIDALIP